VESITLKRLLAGPISGHHAPEIYCLFKKIEYLDTTGADRLRHSKFVALRDDKNPEPSLRKRRLCSLLASTVAVAAWSASKLT